MIKIKDVNRQNWKKILRELDESDFISIPPKLKKYKERLLNKEKLAFVDETLGYLALKNYMEEYNVSENQYYVRNLDFEKFSAKPPLPHQIEDVKYLLSNSRCILGSTMGKGKTLSSIYAALSTEADAKILITTSKSLKYNFANELKIFTDDYVIVENKWEEAKFILIHYDALKKFQNEIIKFQPDILICDEAHLCKNIKTGRGKALNDILKKAYPRKLWMLTGTPIANRPNEFYPILKMLKHPISKNWESYVTRYCEGFKNYFGQWEIGGASNLDELHELTKDILLRRTNKPGDLPPYERRAVMLNLSKEGMQEYYDAPTNYGDKKREGLQDELKGNPLAKYATKYEVGTMAEISVQRQFCALKKIDDGSLFKMCEEILKEDPTNKIIIFSNFTEPIKKISKHFGKQSLKIDGSITDSKKRQDIVDEFNNNPEKRILVMNMIVGSTGYNIQSANYVIVNDMDWVPSTMSQGECRAWRFGQKRKCHFLYPLYQNTIEEAMYEVIESKVRIFTELIDGEIKGYFKDPTSKVETDVSKSVINEVIEKIKKQTK